jgi:hypothetical protein
MFSLKSLLNTSRDMRNKIKVATSMVNKNGTGMIFGCSWSASVRRYKTRGRTLKLITGDTVSTIKMGHINRSRISRKRSMMLLAMDARTTERNWTISCRPEGRSKCTRTSQVLNRIEV